MVTRWKNNTRGDPDHLKGIIKEKKKSPLGLNDSSTRIKKSAWMPCTLTVPAATGLMPEDSLQIIMTHPLVVKQHSDAVIYVYRSTLTAAAFHSVSRPANIVFSMKNTFLSEQCQNQKCGRFGVYMKGQRKQRLTRWGDSLCIHSACICLYPCISYLEILLRQNKYSHTAAPGADVLPGAPVLCKPVWQNLPPGLTVIIANHSRISALEEGSLLHLS